MKVECRYLERGEERPREFGTDPPSCGRERREVEEGGEKREERCVPARLRQVSVAGGGGRSSSSWWRWSGAWWQGGESQGGREE